MKPLELCMKNLDRIYKDQIYNALSEEGIAPGDELYIIRSMCHDCPESDDHCGINCKKKDHKYMEKVKVSNVKMSFNENGLIMLSFIDEDGNDYTLSDMHVTVFTDRDEAVDKL